MIQVYQLIFCDIVLVLKKISYMKTPSIEYILEKVKQGKIYTALELLDLYIEQLPLSKLNDDNIRLQCKASYIKGLINLGKLSKEDELIEIGNIASSIKYITDEISSPKH